VLARTTRRRRVEEDLVLTLAVEQLDELLALDVSRLTRISAVMSSCSRCSSSTGRAVS
jgi:hypothetical protein